MKIDNESFLQGLSDSKLEKHGSSGLLASRAIKAIALASVLTVTGCASPAFQQASDANSNSYGDIELPQIDQGNYVDVVTNAKSGVYLHPLYDGKLATFHFSQDDNAESAIKYDLRRLGLSESNFDYNNALLSIIHDTNSNASRHIQDPVGIYEDINYSYINEHTMSLDLENDFGVLSGEELQADLKYFLLMHEAGHSVIEQQMNMMDFLKIPFTVDQLIYLENSSDTIAALKTTQMMMKAGRSDEHIKLVLDQVISERKSITGVYKDDRRMETSEHSMLHRSVQSLQVVKKMWHESRDAIAGMSNNEMLRVADIVASTSMEYDFKSDFINEMLGERNPAHNGDSKLEVGMMSKQFLNYLDRPVENQNLEFEDELKHNAAIMQKIANSFNYEMSSAIADEIASDPVSYYELNEDGNEKAARAVLNEVVGELKITDVSQVRYIGYLKEMDGFYSSIKDQMRLEGVDIEAKQVDVSFKPNANYGYSY